MAEIADDWIDAGCALALLKDVMGETEASMAICARAHDGMIKARAERFIRADRAFDDVELPAQFWWARGHEALDQNWTTGDFETWIDHRLHWKAYGVSFLRADIDKLVPNPLKEAMLPRK